MITTIEKEIIETCVNCALSFGTGILTECREALTDEGFKFTSEHEVYIFNTYVDKE
jgi:hypothetical protein